MSFVDRLSGNSEDELPDRVHFGRWFLRSGNSGANEYDFVVPGDSQEVLAPPGMRISSQTRFFADALPGEPDIEALRRIGRLLHAKKRWQDWSEASPLVPELDKVVEIHEFDECIERELKHLIGVCQNPRTRIRVEIEQDLVSRVRRIAPNAPVWLASHTEDWDHRNLSGIQPRRILAEIREEKWDLYENRMAVRLVVELNVWLQRRLDQVDRIEDLIKKMEEHHEKTEESKLHNPWWRRTERICGLWGEVWDARYGQKTAKDTRRRLESLRHKVLGLMDSRLYRKIPNAQVPYGIQMTNLLRSDDHYRGVARLWQEWMRLAAPRSFRSSELYARNQELHRSFNAWCMLVAVRACSQLKLNPQPNKATSRESDIKPGCNILLNERYRLVWKQDGTIVLENETGILIRLIPLVHVLEAAQERDDCLTPLVKAVGNTPYWTIILHLASPSNPQNKIPASIGNPPAFHKSDTGIAIVSGAIDFIRVSPFSLESVERVSRAIRWVTSTPQMLAYPFRIPNGQKLLQDNAPWMKNDCVVRPLCSKEIDEISQRIHSARQRSQELQDMWDLGGNANYSKAQRSRLNADVQAAKRIVEKLENFQIEFDRARENMRCLALCPTCGREDTEFKERDHGCFHVTCRSCDARWELQYDSEVRERIPGFLPKLPKDLDKLRQSWPIAIDSTLGCDVLAVPKVRGNRIKFLVPRRKPFEYLRT